MEIPGLNSILFWSFLKGSRKTAITEREPPSKSALPLLAKDRSVDPFDLLCLSCRPEPRVRNIDWPLTPSYRVSEGSKQLYQMYPSFIGLGGLCLPTVDQYSQSMPGCTSEGVPGGVSRHINSRRLSDWLRLERGGKIITTWFKKCFRSKSITLLMLPVF